jgi:hypothetical protein
MKKLASAALLLLCSITLSSLPAAGQSRGAIIGRVTDVSNRALPSAEVMLLDEETNRARSVKADSAGQFTIALLPPGRYRIEASSAGYRKSTRTVVLLVDQEVSIDVPLLPEQSSEEIRVSGQAGLLNTSSAMLSTVIENREIRNLPLDGRNFYELALLVPGSAPAAQGSAGSDRGDFAFHINGGREDANNYLLDGVYNGDPKLNGFAVAPPVDAVREFEMLSNAYDATFGRNASAQLNVVLLSGTNKSHGTVYEFLRNSVLDGTNYFAPRTILLPRTSAISSAGRWAVLFARTAVFSSWTTRVGGFAKESPKPQTCRRPPSERGIFRTAALSPSIFSRARRLPEG